MEGLESVRVRFRSPIQGWLGLDEREVLEPLGKVRDGLKVFEVEGPRTATVEEVGNENFVYMK